MRGEPDTANIAEELLERALDSVWVIDEDGIILFVNPAAEALTGYSRAELVGESLEKVLPPDYAGKHGKYVKSYMARPDRASSVLGQKRDFSILCRSGDIVPVALKAFEISPIDNVRRFGAVMHDISERKRHEVEQKALLEQLTELALTDELTQLPNRRAFFTELDRLDRLTARHGRPASVAIIDLDLFKALNDTQGHAAGDLMLRHVADLLGVQARTEDMVGRIGGEEFGMLLPETTPEQAFDAMERLRNAVAELSVPIAADTVARLTASIGIAGFEGGDVPVEEVLRRADAALYQAKDKGRNRVSVWKPGMPSCTAIKRDHAADPGGEARVRKAVGGRSATN